MSIETIGSLASLTKTVIDTIKSIWDLIDRKQDKDKELTIYIKGLKSSFGIFQSRVEYLCEQLYQTETLTRMLPLWLEEHYEFQRQLWDDNPKDEAIQKLDSGLRSFINNSIHDNFSAMFFETSFNKLPDVPEKIKDIRKGLKDLESSLNGIPYADLQAWRIHLPIIKVRLSDLRKDAVDLDSHCSNLRGKLVQELRDAAKIKVNF